MLLPALTPEGELFVDGRPAGAVEKKLAAAQKAGPLLCLLGTELLTAEVEAPWRWLRDLAAHFFTRLCQTQDVAAIPPPAEEDLKARVEAAPPFPGAEYLNPARLRSWWDALAQHTAQEAASHPDGLAGWLQETGPLWHLVGRVTFHLAENKTDTQRPFAFLATFTEKLSATGQLQHLPLARALQLYTGQKDDTALQALLAPVRTGAAQSPLLREWLETRRLFQPQALTPPEAYRFLKETPAFQTSGIVVKLPDWWQGGKPPKPVVAVTVEPAPSTGGGSLHAGALLSFQVQVALEGEPLTDAEWEKILHAETGLVSLRGKWVMVDGARLQQVLRHWQRVSAAAGEGAVGFLEGMRLLAGTGLARPAAGEAAGDEEAVQAWSTLAAGPALERMLAQLRHPAPVRVPEGLLATLRPYQEKGLAWLQTLARLGLGACLADDMGLGKTLQVTALLLLRRRSGPPPALLVVPASLLGNWRAELARFAPELKVCAAHASSMEREALQAALQDPRHLPPDVDVVITTYALVTRAEAWAAMHWSAVVLDEAQVIKNASAGVSRAVKRLQSPVRIALTGTPVENRPADLWSLFDFLNPGLLGSASAFAEVVKRCATSSTGYAPLRRLVQPYLLRRMKTDPAIIQDLPEKIEVKTWCGLTRRQTAVYAKLVDQLARLLRDKDMDPVRQKGLVLGFLQKFKQVCNHPSHWNGDGAWNPEDSGKFIRLGQLCAEIATRQERALVFTQFQETCAPLARYLAGVFGREGLVLHGGTPVARRPELVAEFQHPGGPPFMVVSVKAGGAGLNLTAASHVIHFDRWWNPAVENQATDRAFRIGQKKNVLVHKFICQGTLEERIDALLEAKQAVARGLLEGGAAGETLLCDMAPEELLRVVALDLDSALAE